LLDQNPPTRNDADLERELTELLCPRIMRRMPKALPYYFHHEKKEREHAKPTGQPPEPDFSFVLNDNPRISFPFDSKVLVKDHPGGLADYVDTVQNRFLACVYAPFCKEGAMLSFLLAGSVAILFASIGAQLGVPLSARAFLPKRPHKTSKHKRTA